MASTAVIGPWSGGLNLTSNRDLSPYLANNELGAALNVQYTREGFIESRPGFRVFPDDTINTGTPKITILGSVFIQNEEVGVVQHRTDTAIDIYYILGSKASYKKTTFTDMTLNFTSVLALNNADPPVTNQTPRGVFLFDGNNINKCFRLEEVPSITVGVTPTPMDTLLKIPASDFSFSVKDRVFLVNKKASMIYWSALNINSLWFDDKELKPAPPAPPGTYTDRAIEAGSQGMDPSIDGTDDLTSVEFVNNSFYLFKRQATYMYTYQAKPEEDGYLRKISEDLGAFDSTLFRNSIIVINDRGIFSVEGTEFIDLQEKLNLRFEYYLDVLNPRAFVTAFNNNILVGYISQDKNYYFVLSGATKGWSEWAFDYADVPLAAPGSTAVFCRTLSDEGIILFTTFDQQRLVYSKWKPELSWSVTPYEYNMDSSLVTDTVAGQYIRYIPKLHLYTKAQLGESLLNFKKIYRSYLRLYLSDVPGARWIFNINYNEYKFDPTKNPQFILITKVGTHDIIEPHKGPNPVVITDQPTALYKRTYQLPLSQQRAIEYVYEITRDYSKLVDIRLMNSGADRNSQFGYYFMLSGIWVDYENKTRI